MNEMIKVGVLGAAGRMGKSVCAAVEADPALTLFAAFDPNGAGAITAQGIAIQVDLDAFLAEGPDVVVDFTVAEATRQNLPRVAAAGIHAVVGTTGCTDDDMVSFEAAFTSSNLLIAANFAISAVLMMRFAEMAAPFFDTGEVIELHHDKKIDAPSGTAVATAERMAAVSTEWAPDPTEHEVYPGARGGKGPAGIRVHSVRMRGMVAHQEVILGALGQSLTIRQDSYDRSSFMPGVVLGCKRVGDQAGVTIGLDAILDI
ncbi:MAG: 4-hydroxy-tetrahydrodipicolinate reductase [Acidimicrobiales bacterium]|jgi:4-hydroxy-tetrahydrodipicolinate reductase